TMMYHVAYRRQTVNLRSSGRYRGIGYVWLRYRIPKARNPGDLSDKIIGGVKWSAAPASARRGGEPRRATARPLCRISTPRKFQAATIALQSAGAATATCAIRWPAGRRCETERKNPSGRLGDHTNLHALVAQLDRASDFES